MHVSLPLNVRGVGVPIVHCVRHRRTLRAHDQYAGTQKNLNQEYINLTRGMEKTCMWLEVQPFGHPGEPRDARHEYAGGGFKDEFCSAYAKRRNKHIWDYKLPWGILWDRQSIQSSYYNCFGRRVGDYDARRLHEIADGVWWALYWNQIPNLPTLGQGCSDYTSFDEALAHAAGADTCLSRFVHESTRSLRQLGHGAAAQRWSVQKMYDKVNRDVDLLDWMPGLKFGHLFLPCATAEVSCEADKGVTRLCFPFLNAHKDLELESAITALCSLTWFLSFVLEKELASNVCVSRELHKMRVKEEDGDLWFNKACPSGRIATVIKKGPEQGEGQDRCRHVCRRRCCGSRAVLPLGRHRSNMQELAVGGSGLLRGENCSPRVQQFYRLIRSIVGDLRRERDKRIDNFHAITCS